MLATFIIGLREGLEATLIVGIIAAFLKKNGRPLAPMWAGVGLALLLSLLVGVGLDVLERALPQAEQEAMETIIGGIAVFFVTGMIVWMNRHARTMKRELEAQAAEVLGRTVLALALMAFLAVMKEGFETAVFLLATFSAAQSAALAAWGAVLGVLLAVAIGCGIYLGGVRINLSRFFSATGFFLILVAAGLVVSALRTAHEAGWLNIGQDRTFDLAWLVTPGTVRSALITGVLGIPADPRLVELCGWLAYFVPVALFLYWPRRYRPGPAANRRLRLALAALCLVAAAGLALLHPAPRLLLAREAPVVTADSGAPLGTARLADGALRLDLQGSQSVIFLPAAAAGAETRDRLAVTVWHLQGRGAAQAPAVLTAEQLVALNGGQVPIGLNLRQHPGPYHAEWAETLRTDVGAADGVLIEARQTATRAVTISGSGFYNPRTFTLPEEAGAWRVAAEWTRAAPAALARLDEARQAHGFWGRAVPEALGIAALLLAWPARRVGRTGQEPPHLSPLIHEGQPNVTN